MTWEEEMYKAIGTYLGLDGKVVGFEDRTEYGGYCDTCYYESVVCDITYVKSDGNYKTHTYYGNFAELVSAITRSV